MRKKTNLDTSPNEPSPIFGHPHPLPRRRPFASTIRSHRSILFDAVWRLTVGLVLFPLFLAAQTAETDFFRAVLLPGNEVPPINNSNRGTADVFVSVVRDASGQILSGTVDVLARVTFSAAVTVISLDIRSGTSGQAGAVAIGTGLTASSSRPLASNGDLVHIPVQVTPDNTAALAVLTSLFQDPAKFYVNLTTIDQPNGAMRGQLQKAQGIVRLGLLSSSNVVPAPSASGYGVAQVVAIGTRDANGNWTSGEVYMTASCFSTDPTAFNGFHIHFGAPGITGAIGLAAPLPAGMQTDPYGHAAIGPLNTEAIMTNTTQQGAVVNLFVNPTSLYVDLHTTGNPNGVLRAQLRPADSMALPLMLDSANEVVKPSVQATAPANFTVYTLRNEDGSLAAGTVLSDIDYRFPGPVQFLGLYVHDGPAAQDGPVSVILASNFASDSGFGSYFGWSSPVGNLAALEDLIKNPENHYINLHTFADPAGAVRAQFGPSGIGPAVIAAAIAGDLDKNAAAVAPGGLISIFGTHLAKVTTDLSGWAGSKLPVSLNGVIVTIGGVRAPLFYVGPGQINAQVPFEVPPGTQMVVVDNGDGPSAGFAVNVAAVAPGIFFYPAAAVLKNANFSLVSGTNPAKAGDVLLIYATGLGQTTPSLNTGVLAPSTTLSNTRAVTVTIGGKPATVAYSIASPQSVGLYQVAVTVPGGVSGTIPLVMQVGGVASNSVNITVQ
jgi:uncharacterized protein (TIGR03437 family)